MAVYVAAVAVAGMLYEMNAASRAQNPSAFNEPQALGVDMNTSMYGMAIPVVYGQNKVTGNCIWYGDFKTTQVSGGKGGGAPNAYTYSASYMLALCEGPVTSFGNVWQGSSFESLSNLNPAFTALGTYPQTPWSHFGGTQALGYNGTALIAFLNNDLGSSPTTPNYQFELNALKQYGGGITDADPKDILTDVCTDPHHGINFSYLGDLTAYHEYCVANGLFLSPVYRTQSPAAAVIADLLKWTNSAGYYSEGKFKVVPYGDTAVTGNGVTFTPDLTPQYNFTDDDYIVEGEAVPLTVTIKGLTDTSNTVRLQYCDRSYYYYSEMVEARDEQDAITNGVRAMSSLRCDHITTATAARLVVQNILQRDLYVRRTYRWRASWQFGLYEPTDIVTVTDSKLGITQALVRLTKCEEQPDGSIDFEAEELPIGVGHSENYSTQANSGYTLNINEDPGPVTDPAMFRYPGFLTTSTMPEIGVAIAGSTDLWGGCQVFLSYDDVNFYYKGTYTNQARYGLIGAAGLPTGSDPDTTNTLNVTLEQGQLIGGSMAEADELQTLALIDNEIISYETATLVSGTEYNLTYLRRGAYNTTPATHSSGATFIRLDDSIIKIPIDPGYVGKTVYVKFLSFNRFGRTPRSLASETSYAYVVGTSMNLPDTPDVPGSFTALSVADGVHLTWNNTNPAAVASTTIEYSPDGTTWSTLHTCGGSAEHYDHHFTNGATWYYRARSFGWLPQAGPSAYTATISNAGRVVPSTSSLPNVIATTAQFTSVAAQWSEVALSDNSKFADLRCGFTCTCTVTDGDTEGYIEFKVTSDATAANANITLVHASSGIVVTQARLRNDGAHHVALDIYMTRTGAKVQVAVAPITGTWNGCAAIAGTYPVGGTVLRSWNMDPANTGSHPGGTGHTGLADKAHQLIASGEVYHGGVQVLDPNQNFVPGADKVPDGDVRKVVTVGTIAARPAATGSQSHYLAVDGSSVATKAVVFRDKGVRTAPA